MPLTEEVTTLTKGTVNIHNKTTLQGTAYWNNLGVEHIQGPSDHKKEYQSRNGHTGAATPNKQGTPETGEESNQTIHRGRR